MQLTSWPGGLSAYLYIYLYVYHSIEGGAHFEWNTRTFVWSLSSPLIMREFPYYIHNACSQMCAIIQSPSFPSHSMDLRCDVMWFPDCHSDRDRPSLIGCIFLCTHAQKPNSGAKLSSGKPEIFAIVLYDEQRAFALFLIWNLSGLQDRSIDGDKTRFCVKNNKRLDVS